MTDEALAASSPSDVAPLSEADYAAIHDVFMETARGRWFLAEFARRNRNADTRMVLDAVARIERSLAAPKDAPAANLADAFAAVREIVADARRQARALLQRMQPAEQFAAAYRNVRAVREVAWTLRECGSDARVCDQLDAQANAIDRNLDQLAAHSPDDTIDRVFDDLIRRLNELADNAPPPSSEPIPLSEPMPTQPHADFSETRVNLDEHPASDESLLPQSLEKGTIEYTAAVETVMAAPPEPSRLPSAAGDEMHPSDHVAQLSPSPASEKEEEAISAADRGLLSDDELEDMAVLDMIALEMAAPAEEEDIGGDGAQDATDETSASGSGHDAPPESLDNAFDFPEQAPMSLGAALIANGTIRPRCASTGPLAAIQRLSQVEKVALFS